MAAEIIPGYFIHTPDEKFGPYANIMEADTAAEKLMSEGVQVIGITKEGFEGVVSYEALEYSAESLADRMPFPPSVPSAGTGSPGQMCEVCNESDDLPYDSDYFKNCRRCGKTVCHECWDTDIESDADYHEICMDCWNVLDNVARYNAESFAADWWVHYDKEIDLPCKEKLLRAYEYIVISNPKNGQEKLSQFLESLGHYQGDAESFSAESSVRKGMMGNTEYRWYVDGDESIQDRNGEPLIRPYDEEEIDEDIQHNIKMLVESGVKTGREYHAIDDSHDRFDEPQSYGIFYSWYAGAESFSAESLEGKKCHEYFGHRGCEGTLWETSLTEVGCDTCDLEHLIRPYGDGKDAESWPASARFCHNCGSDEPYYDYVKCDCGTVNCDACRCGDCGGCHQSAHCHYNTECASCGKHYRSQTCEYCESSSAEDDALPDHIKKELRKKWGITQKDTRLIKRVRLPPLTQRGTPRKPLFYQDYDLTDFDAESFAAPGLWDKLRGRKDEPKEDSKKPIPIKWGIH